MLINDIHKYADYIFETKIDNLYVLPKGALPPNPSELLNSKKNVVLLELLKKYFDIIILDGAPIMGLSDSLILSSLVDKTIIVTSVNHTPKSELLNTKKGLEASGADVVGVVANNLSAPKGHYGGYYYSGYYGDTPPLEEESKKKVRRTKPISARKLVKEENPSEENKTIIDDTIENLLKRK